jgi:hypothetical protein
LTSLVSLASSYNIRLSISTNTKETMKRKHNANRNMQYWLIFV